MATSSLMAVGTLEEKALYPPSILMARPLREELYFFAASLISIG